jgi:hypothetical protein
VQGHHFYGLKKKTLLIIAGKKKKRQWANVDMDYGEKKWAQERGPEHIYAT